MLFFKGCNQLSGVIPDGFYRNTDGTKWYRVINLSELIKPTAQIMIDFDLI